MTSTTISNLQKGLHYFFCKPSVNRSVNLQNRRFQLNFAVFNQKFTGLQLNPFTRLRTRDTKIFLPYIPIFIFLFSPTYGKPSVNPVNCKLYALTYI